MFSDIIKRNEILNNNNNNNNTITSLLKAQHAHRIC